MHEVNDVWRVSMFHCEIPWQTTLKTQFCRMFLMPSGPVFCHFPQWWTQACKSFLFHFCLFMLLQCFGKVFLGVSKGETSKSMQKGKKMDLQNQGRKSNHYFNVKFWHQMLWSYNTVSVVLAV